MKCTIKFGRSTKEVSASLTTIYDNRHSTNYLLIQKNLPELSQICLSRLKSQIMSALQYRSIRHRSKIHDSFCTFEYTVGLPQLANFVVAKKRQVSNQIKKLVTDTV